MLAFKRKAFQSSLRLRAASSVCRYSTGRVNRDTHHPSSTTHDHGEHHSGPKDEPLGMQLYLILAVLPFCYGTYLISRPAADGTPTGITTRITDAYQSYTKTWEERSKLHTDALERAGHDRALFIHSKGSRHIDLRFPEIFNSGSPYNVVAGQGGGNLDALVAHYEKLNAESDEKKTAALQARAAAAAAAETRKE